MIAHFDLASGVAGDMLLASLIDAGADASLISKSLTGLGLGDIEVSTERVTRCGLAASALRIAGPQGSIAPNQEALRKIIGSSDLGVDVKKTALAIADRLAAAEAAVHATTREPRFHEIDGLDTITDIVGTVIALNQLQISTVVASPVTTGKGSIKTSHGVLPVPAPATLELLKGIPIQAGSIEAELATPTGAAIIAEVADSYGGVPPMRPSSWGHGAGTANFEDRPNIVRLVIGEPVAEQEPLEASKELMIEANIDDMNPEIYPYVIEKLIQAGAKDAYIVPAQGKKGRPVYVLSVLGDASSLTKIQEIILTETSTLGLRTTPVTKTHLDRSWVEVEVAGAAIRVKVGKFGSKVVNIAPEYDDCAEGARTTAMALKDVYRQAIRAAEVRLQTQPQDGAP